mgnify:CR=1 FL=1
MSISMDNISTLLNTTASQASNSSNGLEKTLNSDLSGATDDELMDVCKEFEAYFLEQVYKEMKKTIPENEDQDASMSQMTDYFEDEMIRQMSQATAAGARMCQGTFCVRLERKDDGDDNRLCRSYHISKC